MTEQKIVFTNGCFDILHLGHIILLKYASTFGKVIVGLNSDESIKRLKGEARPINNENARKTILESLRFVEKVIIFNELTPIELIRSIKPDLIIKGGDYNKEQVVGADLAEVKILELVSGYSTTNIIKNINNR